MMKQIAKTLGYTMQQLADVTGYTRQGLYNIANRKNKVTANRAKAAVRSLRQAVDCDLSKERERLALLYAERTTACHLFEELMLQEEQNADTNN